MPGSFGTEGLPTPYTPSPPVPSRREGRAERRSPQTALPPFLPFASSSSLLASHGGGCHTPTADGAAAVAGTSVRGASERPRGSSERAAPRRVGGGQPGCPCPRIAEGRRPQLAPGLERRGGAAGGGGAAPVTRSSGGGGGAGAGGRPGGGSLGAELVRCGPGCSGGSSGAPAGGGGARLWRRVRPRRESGEAAEAAGGGGEAGRRERGAAPLGRPGGAAAATFPLGALLPASSLRSRKLSALFSVVPEGSRHGSRHRRGGRRKGVRGPTSRTSPEKVLAAVGELWPPIAGRREEPGCTGSGGSSAAAAPARQPRR